MIKVRLGDLKKVLQEALLDDQEYSDSQPSTSLGWESRPECDYQFDDSTDWDMKTSPPKGCFGESLLREEEGDTPDETDDSLDMQVDRYLSQYEGEAKSSKKEGLDFRMLTRRIVSEAEGDEEGDEGDTSDVAEEPSKLTMDDIDVESFANGVARLIDNYDSLLEVRSTLVRRAKNFLSRNYDQDVAFAFEQSMRDDHGIAPGSSSLDLAAEEFPAPAADRAGDGGGGGGGV